MKAILKFDVMHDDKYICTLAMEYHPIIPLTESEMRTFVLSKRPSLKGKKISIAFHTGNQQQPKTS